MKTMDEIIKALTDLNTNELETAMYSLDTVSMLVSISDDIKLHARQINQCCH